MGMFVCGAAEVEFFEKHFIKKKDVFVSEAAEGGIFLKYFFSTTKICLYLVLRCWRVSVELLRFNKKDVRCKSWKNGHLDNAGRKKALKKKTDCIF